MRWARTCSEYLGPACEIEFSQVHALVLWPRTREREREHVDGLSGAPPTRIERYYEHADHMLHPSENCTLCDNRRLSSKETSSEHCLLCSTPRQVVNTKRHSIQWSDARRGPSKFAHEAQSMLNRVLYCNLYVPIIPCVSTVRHENSQKNVSPGTCHSTHKSSIAVPSSLTALTIRTSQQRFQRSSLAPQVSHMHCWHHDSCHRVLIPPHRFDLSLLQTARQQCL